MLYIDGFAIAGPTSGNPFTIEYEPNEPINGILALVSDTSGDPDSPAMLGITVDGIPLDPVEQSPYFSQASGTDGQLMAWFLGSGIPADVWPTGELAYVFDMDDAVAGAASVRIFHIVSDAGNDTGVAGTGTSSAAAVTDPVMAMGPTTFATLPFGMLQSGHDANAGVAPGAGWSGTEQDQGPRMTSWIFPDTSEELPASDPDTIDLQWIATSEDAAIFGVLVYEIAAPVADPPPGAPSDSQDRAVLVDRWTQTPNRFRRPPWART